MNDLLPAPLVSVVIPAHGRHELLAETLQSLFAQTLQFWEAIVIVDDDSEGTLGWLRHFTAGDSRVQTFARTGIQPGANICRNQGVERSAGAYVVFLDSDDLLEPDCLLGRTQYLTDRPDLDFTVHAMRCFQSKPGDTDLAWNTLTAEDDFERFLRMDGPWQTTGPTWRRSALALVGLWDPELLSLQDLDFHARALTVGLRYEKINAWDCHYRLPHQRKSITSTRRSLAQCQSHMRIAERLLALPDAILDITPNRRDLLAGFCFFMAVRCAKKGDLPAGMALWSAARWRGIVPVARFLEGTAVLIADKFPAIGSRLHDRVLHRWPETLRMVFRDTYLKAPLPGRANDPKSGANRNPIPIRGPVTPHAPALAG